MGPCLWVGIAGSLPLQYPLPVFDQKLNRGVRLRANLEAHDLARQSQRRAQVCRGERDRCPPHAVLQIAKHGGVFLALGFSPKLSSPNLR